MVSRSTPAARTDTPGTRRSPSWYLDPLAARQRRLVHQQLVRGWTEGLNPVRVLKTDCFEEANGEDHILFDLFPPRVTALGADLSWETARRAHARSPNGNPSFLAGDVTALPVRSGSVDLVVSTSTLDHLRDGAEFGRALAEIARVLRPGGMVAITVDNPENPLYPLLKWASRRGWMPFALGHTVALDHLARDLETAGLRVVATGTLIHNVRLLSTIVFLGLRRALGRHADAPIRALLAGFEALGRSPARRYTACFVAACARKPEAATTAPAESPMPGASTAPQCAGR